MTAQMLDGVDEGGRVFRVDFQIDRVDIGKTLEQNRLAFHYRLGGQSPKVSSPKIAVPLEITATILPREV